MPQETINIVWALLAFGAFHSITAATSVKSFVRARMGERIYLGWYCLVYNILSLYFALGSLLEEQKMVQQFGEA
jgi:hypothetical protein